MPRIKKRRTPSTTLSSTSSAQPVQLTTNNPISNHKMRTRKIRSRNKSQKKIQKLFEKLRHESSQSSDTQSNDTVIELRDHDMKCNHISTPVNSHANLIVINDDDEIKNRPPTDIASPKSNRNSSPICCSTPLLNNNQSLTNSRTSVTNNNIIQTINNNNLKETKIINNDSYLTIDLTNETLNITNLNKSQMNSVIDLVNNTDTNDGADENSLNSSMSGDSQVTVLQNKKSKINGKQMEKFISGIAKLNSMERGKLLEVIAQKIMNDSDGTSQISIKSRKNCSTETAEDAYIKEVILGQAPSRNSIGSNIYNPQRDINNRKGLRMVVIDGSNVAMQHSNGRVFSVKGLKICIDYFVQRGHIVKAFVPQFRCKLSMSTDGKLLDRLERQGLVVYTPSRMIQGKQISSYDDRYIVQCAAEFDGVIVSRDNYRDLSLENPRWRPVIENRLLQFTWVGDLIMFPRDPLGRFGPTLEEFLRHPIVVEHPTIL